MPFGDGRLEPREGGLQRAPVVRIGVRHDVRGRHGALVSEADERVDDLERSRQIRCSVVDARYEVAVEVEAEGR